MSEVAIIIRGDGTSEIRVPGFTDPQSVRSLVMDHNTILTIIRLIVLYEADITFAASRNEHYEIRS